LNDPDASAFFMHIPRCFTFDDGSIFVSEHQRLGTLLDVANVVKTRSKMENESVAVYFLIEMLAMAEKLQAAQIIHGDIKPDNFLLQGLPSVDRASAADAREMFARTRPALQLIDFGRSVDMRAFPAGKTFAHKFKTADLRTPEMLEGKEWSYQLDYFGVASTAHVLLADSYMKLGKNKDGEYFPQCQLKRWWNTELWTEFFSAFLNIPSAEELPDLAAWRIRFEDFFFERKAAKFSGVVTGISRSLYN